MIVLHNWLAKLQQIVNNLYKYELKWNKKTSDSKAEPDALNNYSDLLLTGAPEELSHLIE